MLHGNPATLQPCAPLARSSQALAERRWKLVLDSNGRVLHVLSGHEGVFGFHPEELLGYTLGDFVDAFRVGARTRTAGSERPPSPGKK